MTLYAEEDPNEPTPVVAVPPPPQELTEAQEVRLIMIDKFLAECDSEIERRRAATAGKK